MQSTQNSTNPYATQTTPLKRPTNPYATATGAPTQSAPAKTNPYARVSLPTTAPAVAQAPLLPTPSIASVPPTPPRRQVRPVPVLAAHKPPQAKQRQSRLTEYRSGLAAPMQKEDRYEDIEASFYNCGKSLHSLTKFLDLLTASPKPVGFTTIFNDQQLSTPFASTTRKYCTAKGPKCDHWNCTCDGAVRAMVGRAPLLGMVFMVNHDDKYHAFFLPLGPACNERGEPEHYNTRRFERMVDWRNLPFQCGATLSQRWDAVDRVFAAAATSWDSHRRMRLVTFNVIPQLLPFHQQQLATNKPLRLVTYSLFDLQLAGSLLDPKKRDGLLEFDDLRELYCKAAPRPSKIPFDASDELEALLRIKDTLLLALKMEETMSSALSSARLNDSFFQIEQPTATVLSTMECTGVAFLSASLLRVEKQLEARCAELEKTAKELTNDLEFNIASPLQLSNFLFGRMGLTPPTKNPYVQGGGNQNKTETASTSVKVLETMVDLHPLVKLVLEYRGLARVLATQVRGHMKLAKEGSEPNELGELDRVFPQWNQCMVRTGRLSCSKPNVQHVPTKATHGFNPRDAFGASTSGYTLFSCDYSQNEIRVLAHMSKDAELIKLFGGGTADIYRTMASQLLRKQVEAVTDAERAIAKQTTLAIIYGMGTPQVALKLDIDVNAANSFKTSFFQQFSGVKSWMERITEGCRKEGFVCTISGRRRYLPDIASSDGMLRSKAERQAVNSVIQGSAADIMKLAMLKVSRKLMVWRDKREREGLPGELVHVPRLLVQIHDELLFECPSFAEDVVGLKNVLQETCAVECARDFGLSVSLVLHMSCGKTWGDMREVRL